MKEAKSQLKTVRQSKNVQARLYQMYDSHKAGVLLGTWYKLAALGEEEVKKQMKRSTYYWHKKALLEAGVSWLASDVMLKDISLVPQDFAPTRKDPRRIVGESPRVYQQIKQGTGLLFITA